jgi:hypothetical protein
MVDLTRGIYDVFWVRMVKNVPENWYSWVYTTFREVMLICEELKRLHE